MTEISRYDVSELIEAQYQPNSRGRVLRNLLKITGKRKMDELEAREQKRALDVDSKIFLLKISHQAGN